MRTITDVICYLSYGMSVRVQTVAATIAEAYSEIDVLLRERHYSTDGEHHEELALRAARNALLTAHTCVNGLLKRRQAQTSEIPATMTPKPA